MKGPAPEPKSSAKREGTSRRWLRWFLVATGATSVVLVGILAFLLWPRTQTFYTDADTINEPAPQARVRDILWQPPTALPDLINSGADEYEPKLSADGLTLFFVRGKAGHNADIFYCDRTPRGWTDPKPLADINTEYDELGPEPSFDGQSLYFYSDRPGGIGGYDLWVIRRGRDGRSGFGEAMNLGASVNSEFNDYGPAVARDGESLYFASNRPQPTDADQPSPDAWPGTIREDLFQRTYDLYAAPITEQGMGKAQPLDPLNTPFNEGAPAISPFEDFVYFASDRPGGEGGFDLYRTRHLRGQYQPPSNLGATVNTPANELDPGLTMGGYALYFSSDRPAERVHPDKPNPYHVYQTTSREVFTETETHRGSLDWAAVWSMIGANLLGALLALLLLMLLLVLLRDLRGRRLSLLARCLLASLGVHLLLMLLFNVWEVTATLARELGGRGPIQVALVAPARGDDLASQIRGGFTSADAPAQPEITIERRPNSIAPAPSPSMATLEVQRGQMVIERHLEVSPTASDARPPKVPEMPTSKPTIPSSANRTPMDLALPAEAERIREAEDTGLSAPIAVETSTVDRSTVGRNLGDTARPVPQAELMPEPGLTGTIGTFPQSLIDSTPQPQVATTTRTYLPISDAQPSLERPPRLELAVPDVPPSRMTDSEATEPAPPIAPRFVSTPRRTDATEVTSDGPSARLHEIDPTSTVPVAEASSFVEVEEARSFDAQLASASPPPTKTGNVALPGLPFATLDLPRLDEPTNATYDETSWQPAHAKVKSVSRSFSNLPSADQVPSNTAFELAPRGIPAPLVDPGDVSDMRANLADSNTPTPSFPQPEVSAGDIPVPDAATLTLRLPTETLPPENAYARRSRDQRAQRAKELGGSNETEDAVELALRWLAAHQSTDGRWDGAEFDHTCGECGGETHVDVDVALTGLSLLCFLAADHTHDRQGPYQDTVKRALHWLTGRQQRDGDLRRGETMYSQGIATIALAEGYGMTRDPHLREPVERAVWFIEGARNRRVGGWRYDPGQPGDTSVLGWQIMALKSAKAAGVNVPMEPFLAASEWLDTVSEPSAAGLYAYQPGSEPNLAMTAEGLFIQQILGRRPTEFRMRQSVNHLLDHLPDWEGDLNTYYWYYATLALFHHQGEPWARWNEALTEQLLAHQRRRGPPAGSWDPEGKWAKIGGRVYQTAMCTLMLEVYYRYLPLFLSDRPTEAIGTIEGNVTDAASGDPIPGATVKLDLPDRPPIEAITGADGTYRLFPPEVPTFFALSASGEGYVPTSHNVASALVAETTLSLDFELERETAGVIAIEAVPDVHHLGDDRFEGRINSQFQKQAEGARFAAEFTLTAGQLHRNGEAAEVTVLVKGVQLENRIRINGHLLDERLDDCPNDGSFGRFTAPFDPALLHADTNTIEIIADRLGSDVDDFEFVNLQIRLSR